VEEREHEFSDADDRTVELDEPEQPEPPVDDADRDPAFREREEWTYPDELERPERFPGDALG
jgi:hypothetical protein